MRDPRDRRRGEGESIATMWGRLLTEVEGGEVVSIANKFGVDVAVMVSQGHWEDLQQRIVELEARAGEIEG